jgi:hypothetical protein
MIAATCYGLPVHNSPKQIYQGDPNPTSQARASRQKRPTSDQIGASQRTVAKTQ